MPAATLCARVREPRIGRHAAVERSSLLETFLQCFAPAAAALGPAADRAQVVEGRWGHL